MRRAERTPLNAPGPFFTEKDFCLFCHAPEAEAPDLMAFDEERNSCYFRRQPETPEEIERACHAIWASCCGAVQYDGDDPAIRSRIEELHQPQRGFLVRLWSRVRQVRVSRALRSMFKRYHSPRDPC